AGGGAAGGKRAPRGVVVRNGAGGGAPGSGWRGRGLRRAKGARVSVGGPAENKSGSSDTTTPGTLTTAQATTTSGYPAIAVDGYPADTVNFALDGGIPTNP